MTARVARRRVDALAPVVLAAVLAAWGITREHSMWRDEAVTYQVAHRSVGDIWRLLGNVDAVHGLYYLFMHMVFGVWDGGLIALRLPSAVAFVATAWLVTVIGRRWISPVGGLAAGVVYVLLPIDQMYAQEGRSYALVTLAVAAAIYFALRYTEERRTSVLVLFAAALLVAAYLNVFALLLAAAVVPAAARHDRTLARPLLLGCVASVAGALPLLVVSAGQSGAQLNWVAAPGVRAWAFAVAASAVAITAARLARSLVATLAAAVVVVPNVVLLVESALFTPRYVERYLVWTYVGLAVAIGVLADRLRVRRTLATRPRQLAAVGGAAALVALLVPWLVVTREPGSRKDDVVAIAATVGRVQQPGDGVIFLPARRREWLLSTDFAHVGVKDLALATPPARSATLEGVELAPARIGANMIATRRIIVLSISRQLPKPEDVADTAKIATLHAVFVREQQIRVPGGWVSIWRRR